METIFQTAPRHVLVPTSFSATSQVALEHGCQLAHAFSAQLTLLHVTEVSRISRSRGGLDAIDQLYDVLKLPADEGRVIPSHHSLERLSAQAERRLLQAIPEEWRDRLQVETIAVPGQPLPEIVRFARTHEADVIIMGTHRRPSLTRWLWGSLADNVVRQVTCPVLVVQPETTRRPLVAPGVRPLPEPSLS